MWDLLYQVYHQPCHNMSNNKVARVNVDIDSKGNLIVKGAKSVFIDNQKAAYVGSTLSDGSVVRTSEVTVFVENKKIAVLGSNTSKGRVIRTANKTVFAGNQS
jgi:uncharacterized Zn-binding protein involved in type VI secretion